MKKAISTILIMLAGLLCAAQDESISNIVVTQRTDGTGLVDVYFSLSGPDSSYNIRMEISFDSGTTYDSIPPYYLSGDVGGISPGDNKHVVWDGLGSHPGTNSAQSVVKIIAVVGIACPDTITDIDGNVYNTVIIGTQCWMAESLETTKYKNGNPVDCPGADNTTWENNTTGAYAWYNNDISWKDSYGALYNWYAAVNPNGLCPTGWHVPSDDEFAILLDFLGGQYIAGGKLKSTRTDPDPHPRWDNPNTGASNQSNWSGLPNGYRENLGDYSELGAMGVWWTTTPIAGSLAWSHFVVHDSQSIEHNNDFSKAYGLSVRCVWEETSQSSVPAVETAETTEIQQTSAVSGGNVVEDGGENVTARGVVWATFENPTLDANVGYTIDGTGTGAFVSYITWLTPGTQYYVRAYATNSVGTAYGNQEQFVTEATVCVTNTVTDFDGNVYNTVAVGNHCWMAENLETTHYSNGNAIDFPGTDTWAWYNNTTGAYAWYNNDISWKDSYGALYNFHAVENTSGLCPSGWHVPTDDEWTVLTGYLGGEPVAGGKLKSTRTDPEGHPRWNTPNTGATNESNWKGYPGGFRDYMGYFGELGTRGAFWSSTAAGFDIAYSRSLYYNAQNMSRNSDIFPGYGLSIRCVQDE